LNRGLKDSIDELPNRIDITAFYRYAVFIVFAVVIAESFPQSVAVFLPPEGGDTNEFYSDFFNNERVENILLLILAYTFIIAGWLNYFRASVASPHTETRFGAARFVIDLFIIYLYYYLLKVIPTQNLHGQVFVWILPIISGSFLLWDVLRYYEYQRRIKPDQRHGIRGRILLTATMLGVIVTAAVFYASPKGFLSIRRDKCMEYHIHFMVFCCRNLIPVDEQDRTETKDR
jgi:hypothetical protein